jgi:hypothetical protein
MLKCFNHAIYKQICRPRTALVIHKLQLYARSHSDALLGNIHLTISPPIAFETPQSARPSDS